MGDCKDHATLLEALLAAQGIKSTQALVNARNVYTLPKVPIVSTVNHVINYIPALGLYVDSTVPDVPFGMLPFSDYGKPVLLVDGYQEGARTPIPAVGKNKQHIKTILKISSDGGVTGEVDVSLEGFFAVNARSSLRHMSKDVEAKLVDNMLKGAGYIGTGAFEKEDPTALIDTYSYKIKVDLKQFLQRPGAGAFNIYPLFSTEAPIGRHMSAAQDPEFTYPISCTSVTSIEEYVYEFPDDMTVLAVPDDKTVEGNPVSYRATYKLKGKVLEVRREFEDHTRTNVCGPEITAEYKRVALEALPNFKSQVVYK
jgi:hypothetical protein